MSVPESDVPVSGASTSRQKAILVWRPANSFDCCSMLVELDEWTVRVQVPDHQFVVVAS